MKVKFISIITVTLLVLQYGNSQSVNQKIKITKRYLHLPIRQSAQMDSMHISGNKITRDFAIRLSDGDPDYWVFMDLSEFGGKDITISYPKKVTGLDKIYQSDEIPGADSLYKEKYRPQLHFTTRRGWTNDPNGLVYHNGEYHLYYQHNPYDINWGNMHWGHAVSKDLIHWKELPIALYPDELGTMFSGSAIIDKDNVSGFGKGTEPPLLVYYTADNRPDNRETQCMAYSVDNGRTFTKFTKNPIINSKEKWDSPSTRDPKVFKHEESGKWVMVLYEKDGHSIYNSSNLKDWAYQSHLQGFFECPELFKLQVQGTKEFKWVMYGAAGTYMIGAFDGKKFVPETGRLNYVHGKLYAAQTYNNIPESDGRRIQVGWSSLEFPGMPFKSMMSFPTEFTLRETKNGIRLFSNPIEEIEQLHQQSNSWNDLSVEEANKKLSDIKGDLFHIRFKVQMEDGYYFRFLKGEVPIATYSAAMNTVNEVFYDEATIAEDMTISMEMILDGSSYEIFVDEGKLTLIDSFENDNNGGFKFETQPSGIKIKELDVHKLKSAW